MTNTETHSPIAQRRRDFVERQILRTDVEQSGVEWFEQLHTLRARGSQLGGAERWDRVLRWIDVQLDAQDRSNREIVVGALVKFMEAVNFPRL